MPVPHYLVDLHGKKIPLRGNDNRKAPLPPELRELPSEFVTTDIADAHRVHALDAPHILDAIVTERIEDIAEAETAPPTDEPKKRPTLQPLHRLRFTDISPEKAQFEIDVIRLRVMRTLVDRFISEATAGLDPDTGVQHLLFPTDNLNEYQLHPGNPPRDKDRPKWLRGLRIEIDIQVLPETVAAILKEQDNNDEQRSPVLNRVGA